MKSNRWFRSGLLLLLCALLCSLLVSCGTPAPEGSSVPAESDGSVPVAADKTAATVRAYFEELFAEEDSIEWIPSDRVEPIRESVKKLKTPILTKEDILRLAQWAAAFYVAALEEEERAFFLPAYGPVAAVQKAPMKAFSYTGHAMAYNALLCYTCYLFTPPDYLFRETDLNEADLPTLAQSSLSLADVALCLPLAGEYTTRMEALSAIEKCGCILLYPPEIGEGEYPLDFTDCLYAADCLNAADCTELDLLTRAGDGFLRYLNAPNYVLSLLNRYTESTVVPWEPLYDEAGVLVGASMPFSPEIARELRETADLLSEPLLESFQFKVFASLFQADALGTYDPALPILLPDADGTGEVTLDAAMPLDERLRRAFAYTVDLFTPRAYRFADLTDRAGTYFATGNWISDAIRPEIDLPPDTPETMLADFYAGEQQFVLVTEDCELYLIDGEGNTEPLLVREGREGA